MSLDASHYHRAPTRRQIKCSHFVNVTAPRVNGMDCYLSISIRFALQDAALQCTQLNAYESILQIETKKIYGNNSCLTFSSNISFHIVTLARIIKFKVIQSSHKASRSKNSHHVQGISHHPKISNMLRRIPFHLSELL
jgi:hypothetical protein